MKASEIATEAARLVNGDRNDTHGDKTTNHGNIASLWNAYLGIRREPAARLSAEDVAIMMALLKIARTQTGSLNLDDHIDAAGYVAIAGEIAQGAFRKVED
jgi:hypothetical protein